LGGRSREKFGSTVSFQDGSVGMEFMTDDSSEAEKLWEQLLAFDCVKEVVVLDEPEWVSA
jgi:hypothetical protein